MSWWIVALLAGVVLSAGVGLRTGRPISRTQRDVVRELRARYPGPRYPLRWPNNVVIIHALLQDVERLAIAEGLLRKTFAGAPVGAAGAPTNPVTLTPDERAYLTWLITREQATG